MQEKRRTSKLNSPFFMLYAAADFFKNGAAAAAKSFKAERNEIKNFDSLIHARLSMPIVNIVFSLELIFKGLIKERENKLVTGHDLTVLYDGISRDIKDRIINHFANHDQYKN